mmetsp:Transcript_24643/g.53158  ORF Transcript_24643/g.53158 Transcript_24643/m.53158 type:complete len:231 (+) Transcript_24643:470-1162(+)
MVISMSLQLVHGLLCILAMNKRNKGKPTGLHRLLILGKVHPRDTSKGLKQILKVSLGGILGNVRDTNGILIAIVIAGRSPRSVPGSRCGQGSEGLAPHARPRPTCRRRNVLAPPSAGPASSNYGPSIVGCTLGRSSRVSIDIVLSLQIPHVLLGPEGVQISCNGLAHIFLLQIDIGIRILNVDIITTMNGDIGLILFDCGLTELFPFATGGHGYIFRDLVVRDADFRSGL